MGIKNLKKFLRTSFPQVFYSINFSNLNGKKIAVDVSSYIYKYKTVMGDRWLKSFFTFMCLFKRNNVHGVFIFDGKAPKEKDGERQKRKKQRDEMDEKAFHLSLEVETYKETKQASEYLLKAYESIQKNDSNTKKINRLLHAGTAPAGTEGSGTATDGTYIDITLVEDYILKKEAQLIHITNDDISNLKTLFQLFGATVLQAPGEAEALGSYLCSTKECDAILSEDSDVLAYGTEFYLSDLNTSSGECCVISYSSVLSHLGFSKEEFLDFCIMCGNDYNDNIPGIASKNACKLIQEHHSIETIGTVLKKDISILKHTRSRQLFLSFGDMDDEHKTLYKKIDYWDPNICFEDLFLFLKKNKIWYDEETLRGLYKPRIVFNE
jgi:5'-3' exonuclease